MIEITKEHVGKEVLVQKIGSPFEHIECTVVDRISPNGCYVLLRGDGPEHVDIGWVKIGLYRIADVLE